MAKPCVPRLLLATTFNMEQMTVMRDETITSLLGELELPADHAGKAIDLLGAVESRFTRDLKLNLKAVLKSQHIDPKGSALIALSVAINQKNGPLIAFFTDLAKKEGASEAEIAEMAAVAGMMATNNVLYRFRHFSGKTKYNELRAGLRMNSMMSPVTGKEFFELLSLVISAVNGCEQCVKSHEASLIGMGTTEERIFDAVRIASVIAGLDRIVH